MFPSGSESLRLCSLIQAMQVIFSSAQRPPPRAFFLPDMKATSGNKRSLQLPKQLTHGPAAHHPTTFNMRMQRATVVAEKKVCSSRQSSLNKTIPHAGLLVAACHNIYPPEHGHDAKGGSSGRSIEHIKEAFTSQKKSLSLSSDKSSVTRSFKDHFFQIPVLYYYYYYLRASFAKCFHLYQVTISLSYWTAHRILLGANYCLEWCCVGSDSPWGGRKEISSNLENQECSQYSNIYKTAELRKSRICFPWSWWTEVEGFGLNCSRGHLMWALEEITNN